MYTWGQCMHGGNVVGIGTFIKYFNQFKSGLENQALITIFKQNNEIWNNKSCSTKASSGKAIFRLGLEKRSLSYIVNEADQNKIGAVIKEIAKSLLEEYSNTK